MANSLYDAGREGIADDTISLPTGVLKAMLVRGTFNTAHRYVSDFTTAGGTIVATSVALSSKTYTAGVIDAADISFTSVPAGAACPAIIIVQASAVGGGADVAATAQRLIGWVDTGSGLPVTPDGNNVNVTWDNTANRILKL